MCVFQRSIAISADRAVCVIALPTVRDFYCCGVYFLKLASLVCTDRLKPCIDRPTTTTGTATAAATPTTIRFTIKYSFGNEHSEVACDTTPSLSDALTQIAVAISHNGYHNLTPRPKQSHSTRAISTAISRNSYSNHAPCQLQAHTPAVGITHNSHGFLTRPAPAMTHILTAPRKKPFACTRIHRKRIFVCPYTLHTYSHARARRKLVYMNVYLANLFILVLRCRFSSKDPIGYRDVCLNFEVGWTIMYVCMMSMHVCSSCMYTQVCVYCVFVY